MSAGVRRAGAAACRLLGRSGGTGGGRIGRKYNRPAPAGEHWGRPAYFYVFHIGRLSGNH